MVLYSWKGIVVLYSWESSAVRYSWEGGVVLYCWEDRVFLACVVWDYFISEIMAVFMLHCYLRLGLPRPDEILSALIPQPD